MKKLLSFLIVLVSIMPLQARSLAQIQKRSFMVGIVKENAPLGIDHRGPGVENELIAAIAKELGVPFSLVPVNGIRDGEALLKQDKIDALVAAYKDSPKNAAQFLLTSPYFKSGLGIMVPSSDNSTYMVKDLDGKNLATTANADSRDFFKNFMPSSRVDVVSRLQDAYNMLKTHEVAGIADDKVFLDYLASKDNSVRVLDAVLSESSFVIAVNKPQNALRDELNRILDRLRTTTNTATPSFLRGLLQKYGLAMPLSEIVNPSFVTATSDNDSDRTTPTAANANNKGSANANIAQRLDQLEALLNDVQKEIKEMRKLVKTR